MTLPWTEAQLQHLAQRNRGECLIDPDQRHLSGPIRWRCSFGHVWKADPVKVEAGHWCPKCQSKSARLEVMRRAAESRSGKCLSTEYIDSQTNLRWQCAKGHTWQATPNSVVKNSGRSTWCPECVRAAYRYTLEEIQEVARKRGGQCLSTTYKDASAKLRWKCAQGHIWAAEAGSVTRGTWCRKCSAQRRKLTIEEMQQIASQRGGECLSSTYVDSNTKLEWRCKNGHRFRMRPYDVKAGKWCSECAGVKPLTIEQMRKLAASRGGKCLSSAYENNRIKLHWQCHERHRWQATPHAVNSGKWCPVCAGNQLGSIEEMRKFAQERGGKCLSTKYLKSQTNLRWKCAKGHEWNAKPANVKYGSWCPVCGEAVKFTIAGLQVLAAKRGGRCLSTAYRNRYTKLRWICKRGHRWRATPDVAVGTSASWCPRCAEQ